MPGFSPKNTQIDWVALQAVDIDALAENGGDDQLEDLYSSLVTAEAPSASEVSSEDLVRLFRITQMAMELKNVYLEEAETEIEALEGKTATQDREIKCLQKYTTVGVELEELSTLQRAVLDCESQNEKLQLEISELETSLQSERIAVHDLQCRLQLANEQAADADVRAERSLADAKELREQVAELREKAINKRHEEEFARATVREKSQEAERYLQEINMLSDQSVHLAHELESVTVELEAAMTEIENNKQEQDRVQEILLDNDRTIRELATERGTLLLRVQELAEKAEVQRIRDEERIRTLQNELERFKADTSAIRSDVSEKERIIRRLEVELSAANEELDTYNVDGFKKVLRERDELIGALRAKLNESCRDFELLSADWDKIDALIKSKEKEVSATAALKNRLASASMTAERLTAYQKLHKEDFRRIRALEELIRVKDTELVDIKKCIADMQNGVYGLNEALAENKELVIQKCIRDKNILSLTAQVNELQRVLDTCMEENEVMRERLGIADQGPIDTSKVKHRTMQQLDQIRSDNDVLRRELDVAERECSTVKAQLRLRDLELESRSHDVRPRTEELLEVEGYARRPELNQATSRNSQGTSTTDLDNLKDSPTRVSEKEPSPIESVQVERLLSEMGKLHVEFRQQIDGRQEIEETLHILTMENKRLQDIVKGVSNNLTGPRSLEEVGTAEMEPQSVACLVSELENAKTSKSFLEAPQGTIEDQSELNRVLREENDVVAADLKAQIFLIGEKDKTIERLRPELDVAKSHRPSLTEEIVQLSEHLTTGGERVDFENLLEQLAECLRDLEERDAQINHLQKVLAEHEV